MSDAVLRPRHPLLLRIVTSWTDVRSSFRRLIEEEPGEGRLLFYAMLSGFVWFLGETAALWLDPATGALPPDELTGRVAALFVGALFFRTLMLYGLSGVVGLVAARAGGTGAWRDTRAAVFWSALLAAPVGLVATLLAAILPQVQGGSGIILGMLAPVAFATALSLCLAEAHGFRSASRVFVCVGFVASGVVAAVWLAGTL